MADVVKRTLMNKNTPVFECDYSVRFHSIIEITQVLNPEFAPLDIVGAARGVFDHALSDDNANRWWGLRAIPASRDHLRQSFENLSIDRMELMERNYGLSLSDQYWLKPDGFVETWDDINFFTNGFSEDVGKALFNGVDSSAIEDFCYRSADSTLGGQQMKKWIIQDGERVLIKGSTQPARPMEPYNELIATKLYERLLSPSEYVSYLVSMDGNAPVSSCRNMLNESTELIPAAGVINAYKENVSDNDSSYASYLHAFETLGLEDPYLFISKLLFCDYIIANQDRHLNNFGVIRNVESLEVVGYAPIFDNGFSMMYNFIPNTLEPEDFMNYKSKPFDRSPAQQLRLISDLSWLDLSALEGFSDEVRVILRSPSLGLSEREQHLLVSFVGKRIEYALNAVDSN